MFHKYNIFSSFASFPLTFSSVHIVSVTMDFFYLFWFYLCFISYAFFVTLLCDIQILVFLKVFYFEVINVLWEKCSNHPLQNQMPTASRGMEFGMLQFGRFLYNHILWFILYILILPYALLGTLMYESFLVQFIIRGQLQASDRRERCSPLLSKERNRPEGYCYSDKFSTIPLLIFTLDLNIQK